MGQPSGERMGGRKVAAWALRSKSSFYYIGRSCIISIYRPAYAYTLISAV